MERVECVLGTGQFRVDDWSRRGEPQPLEEPASVLDRIQRVVVAVGQEERRGVRPGIVHR